MPGKVVDSHPGIKSASGAQCRNYSFPVTERAGSKHVYKMVGQLCTKHPESLGKQPLQILIHGGTYNHSYFDWPYKPDRYNYVREMTNRGYTTLNIDRLGDGLSDRPNNATSLNFNVAGYNAHQIVQYLRHGALGRPFRKIAINGYSMGGLTAQVEAAKYNDVDAIAVHAVGHHLVTARSTARFTTLLYPAALDPKFPKPLAAGYTTTIPGTRGVFYGPPGTYDPKNLEYEEKLKDTLSLTELTDITLKSYTNLTKKIRVPVLWTPGRYDKIWCGTTDDCKTDPETKNESNYYKPGVLTKYVVPDTGHGALLGYGGKHYLTKVTKWLGEHDLDGVS